MANKGKSRTRPGYERKIVDPKRLKRRRTKGKS